jgi:hypothetical protein
MLCEPQFARIAAINAKAGPGRSQIFASAVRWAYDIAIAIRRHSFGLSQIAT